MLVGPTYLHRLWCMVEVLAFFRMNKGINQITLIPLDPTDVLSEVSTVRPPSAPQDASPPVASVEPSSSSGMTQPPLSPAEPLAALEERVAVLERGHREMVAANEALHQRMRATEDLRLALDRFRAFDVNEANCYLECDRQRLLGVVDAAYGSLDEFNRAVKGLFKQENAHLFEWSSKSSVSSSRSSRTRARSPTGTWIKNFASALSEAPQRLL